MSTITQAFQPPLYWQQFEDLTEGVFRVLYNDNRPTKFARVGQAQNGVDVYGRENGTGRLIGIQCKRMDELDEKNQKRPGGAITQKIINAELEKVRGFKPALDPWVLATTAKRDANIQRYVLDLDEEAQANGLMRIQVWFWDDFVTDLNRNHDLQKWYYDQVIQVHSSDDQDAIILELLGEAFARAAFRAPLHQETPADFLQALKDTQHVLNTGELKDRETRRVIRKTIGGRRAIANLKVSDELRLADQKLQELRELFQENFAQNIIQQSGAMLMIPPQLSSDLTKLRKEALASINKALKYAGLQAI